MTKNPKLKVDFEGSTPISTAEAEAETGTNKPKISLTKLRKMTVLELKTELRNTPFILSRPYFSPNDMRPTC